MTADEFRALALDLPGALEDSHMGHPDFRIDNRIFATLGPKPDHGMVKLPVNAQQQYVRDHPQAFQPIEGAWGAKGATRVILSAATTDVVRPALAGAWRSVSEAAAARRGKR
jgi:hypothetical protein